MLCVKCKASENEFNGENDESKLLPLTRLVLGMGLMASFVVVLSSHFLTQFRLNNFT